MEQTFETHAERNSLFQKLEFGLVDNNRAKLETFWVQKKRPSLCLLENKLAEALTEQGFVQVSTPIILAKGLLAKMSIEEDHPLFRKVFWIDSGKCLRPMLAPNLYFILKDLQRLWSKPVRLFEINSCFRKESEGAHHLNKFTMLNLVEMGLPAEACSARLNKLAELVLFQAGIINYTTETTQSDGYGSTVDYLSVCYLGEQLYRVF